jgi:hypothetical protein
MKFNVLMLFFDKFLSKFLISNVKNLVLKLSFNFTVTSQLCSNIINQLMHTTNSVLCLHQRLKTNDEATGTGRSNNLMLKELENAVIMTQNMLTKITNR